MSNTKLTSWLITDMKKKINIIITWHNTNFSHTMKSIDSILPLKSNPDINLIINISKGQIGWELVDEYAKEKKLKIVYSSKDNSDKISKVLQTIKIYDSTYTKVLDPDDYIDSYEFIKLVKKIPKNADLITTNFILKTNDGEEKITTNKKFHFKFKSLGNWKVLYNNKNLLSAKREFFANNAADFYLTYMSFGQKKPKIKHINAFIYIYQRDMFEFQTTNDNNVNTIKSLEERIESFKLQSKLTKYHDNITSNAQFWRILSILKYLIDNNNSHNKEYVYFEMLEIVKQKKIKLRPRNKKIIDEIIESISLKAKPITLSEHQKLLLNDFKKINEEFKENNIKWWGHSGTLLGAIRHKGLIPWDDDIDMAMTISDFDNRKEEIKKIINKYGYKLIEPLKGNELNEKKIILPRIIKYNYSFIYSNNYIYPTKQFIDIMLTFPINNLEINEQSDDAKKLRKSITKRVFRQAVIENKIYVEQRDGFFMKIANKYCNFTLGKHFKKMGERDYNNLQMKYDYWAWKHFIYDVEKLEEIEFNDTKILISNNWKQELNVWYGKDWMVENKNIETHIGAFHERTKHLYKLINNIDEINTNLNEPEIIKKYLKNELNKEIMIETSFYFNRRNKNKDLNKLKSKEIKRLSKKLGYK